MSHDPDTRDYLEAFRTDVDVPVDVDAAWARFRDEAVPAPRRRMLWWAGGVAAAAAAMLLVWATSPGATVEDGTQGAGHQARDQRVEVGADRAAVSEEPLRSRPAEASLPSAGVLPGAADSSSPGVPEVADDDAPPERRKAMPRREQVKSTPEPRSSRLAEELRLVEGMRRATKQRRFEEALTLVGKHEDAFGTGSFAAERELTRVRALCGLRRFGALASAKADFARRHPASHLGSLVRAACEDEVDSKLDHDE